ncbi:MAG TPA: hypothetical protein VG308_10405 [Stellaceae bacterium]|nr:hypothetical protein [Stellaceae bacterium]
MNRFGGVFWFVLVIASGMTNFLVKQTVQNLDEQLVKVRHQAVDEQRKIHDLTADWTYLNQPELLANLNNTYVHLQQVSPKQIVSNLDDIPLRPAPAPSPPETPAPLVAEATPLPATPIAPPLLASVMAPGPARSPIVPVSVSVPAAAPPPARERVAAAMPAPVRAQPPPAAPQAAKPASLDALFAQVTGSR